MFTNFLKISFFLILLFVSSCGGLKKSWEESGVYTVDKDLASKYVWKKGHWKKKKRLHHWVSGDWKVISGGFVWVRGHWVS